MLEEDFECPWCGTCFKNGRELDLHAKDHYVKTVAALFEQAPLIEG